MPSRKLTTYWTRPLGLALALASLSLTGCDEPREREPTEPRVQSAEERFETMVNLLKRTIEQGNLSDTSSVADFNAAPGIPVTTAKFRVDHELEPPTKDGTPRKATVCFRTRSKVIVTLPGPSDEEMESDRAKTKSRIEEAEEGGIEGVPDMESLIVPERSGMSSRIGQSPVHEIDSGEEKTCYPLEFREGRWQLVEPLDDDDDPFYSSIIEYALKRQ